MSLLWLLHADLLLSILVLFWLLVLVLVVACSNFARVHHVPHSTRVASQEEVRVHLRPELGCSRAFLKLTQEGRRLPTKKGSNNTI